MFITEPMQNSILAYPTSVKHSVCNDGASPHHHQTHNYCFSKYAQLCGPCCCPIDIRQPTSGAFDANRQEIIQTQHECEYTNSQSDKCRGSLAACAAL